MTDAELNAVSALVNATAATMAAANADRERKGYALAYPDWPQEDVKYLKTLEAELKLRGIVA